MLCTVFFKRFFLNDAEKHDLNNSNHYNFFSLTKRFRFKISSTSKVDLQQVKPSENKIVFCFVYYMKVSILNSKESEY